MKDMDEASYVIGIKIHRDRFRGILGLSQETYINKFLERYRMKDCSPSVAPIVKGDRFNLNQCPKNDLEREQMKNITYASTVGSLMYAQVCTIPDIAFTVGMLGRYQIDPGLDHWRAEKKVMNYIRGTKDYMLMYILFEAALHGVWIKNFISGLRIMDSISKPLRIYCDNSAAGFMAKKMGVEINTSTLSI